MSSEQILPVRKHDIITQQLLTADSPIIELQSTMFKKPLYDYQKSAVARILDIEHTRHVVISPTVNKNSYTRVQQRAIFGEITTLYEDASPAGVVATTNACVLSEPYGSGKTIIVLAVIATQPKVQAYPENVNKLLGLTDHNACTSNTPFGYTSGCSTCKIDDNDKFRRCSGNKMFNGFHCEIYRKFKTIMPCSMICVGGTVLLQWEAKIKEFTHLSCYVIKELSNLKEFIDNYNFYMTCYDIILIKNGLITGELYLEGETPTNTKSSRYIMNILAMFMMRKSLVCQWGVYDDYDVITANSEVMEINSLFKIYVSATSNVENEKKGKLLHKNISHIADDNMHMTAEKYFTTLSNNRLNDVWIDQVLFTHFNVKSDKSYITQSTNLPIYYIYRCKYDNPNDKYMKLLGVMGTEQATAIMEALNGDAIHTAATALGVVAEPNAGSVFQKVLEKEWEKYESAVSIITVVNSARKYTEEIPREYDAKGNEKRYSNEALARIKRKLISNAKKRITSFDKYITFRDNNIFNTFDEVESEAIQIKNEVSRIIDRVKENIKTGDCPVCCCPFDDIIITKCCNLSICGACLKGSFWVRTDQKIEQNSKKNTITGSCANCKKSLDMSRDIVYVTKGISIDELVKTGIEAKVEIKQFSEITAEPEVKPAIEQPESSEQTEQKFNIEKFLNESGPKMQALYEIIHGKVPPSSEKCNYEIANLMQGIRDIPYVGSVRKILLFAGYNETLYNVQKFTEKIGCKTFILQGRYSAMTEILSKFRECPETSILLINSNQNCAGMDIQYATDLVFFHKICNTQIEGQVAGRMQRVGRTANFNVFYLVYNNEVGLF